MSENKAEVFRNQTIKTLQLQGLYSFTKPPDAFDKMLFVVKQTHSGYNAACEITGY